MTTCQEIITGAIVELGARVLGDPPSAEESQRGMDLMQAMYREGVDKGIFGRVSEVLASANYTAKENERITANGYTITLPTSLVDAVDGTTRPPRDLAMVQVIVAGSEPQVSLWDAELGQWVRLDGLSLSGTAPLASRNRHGLECSLACKLAPSLLRPIPDACQAYAAGFGAILSNRLSAPRTYPAIEFY